jgi:hypothetical protein
VVRQGGSGVAAKGVRLLAVADEVSPVIHSPGFPDNLSPFDLVLSAGDMPGEVLEFIATKTRVPPLYVVGNHGVELLRERSGAAPHRRPGGCVDVHLRYVEVAGVTVLGFEGSARYRDGPFQYSEREFACMVARLTPRLLYERRRRGRAVDVLLTHAPPVGPSAGPDHAHRGVPAFNAFHRRWRPLVHVHGHLHLEGGGPREHVTEDGVRVVNAFGYTLIDL